MDVKFSPDEFAKLKDILPVYEWAQRALLTKLSIIQDSLKTSPNDGLIENIKGRIKAPERIAAKLYKFNLDITAANAKNHLYDIAAVRIICSFARDIYYLLDLLRIMPDITILEEKDYITNPKPSGYRSYHLLVKVPIFYSGKTEHVPAEIQIRTEAMNFWATLEHKARYRYKEAIPKYLSDELEACAKHIAQLDEKMFQIHEKVSSILS